MAWYDSTSYGTLSYTDAAGSLMSGKVQVKLQYDSDTETPTQCKVRFKLEHSTSDTSNFWDSMYILYDANDNWVGRTVYKFKSYKENTWPSYTEAFWIYKDYDDQSFELEDLWICNNGNTAVGVSASSFYTHFGGDRKNYKCAFSARNMNGIKASDNYTGTTTITDNGNNTFTISATKGSAGANNTSYGPSDLKWGYWNSKYSYDYSASGSTFNHANYVGFDNTSYWTVFAKSSTTGAYGPTRTSEVSQQVKQYYNPKTPGKPGAPTSTKSRLTEKETWTWSWTNKGSVCDTTSWVRGFSVRLYVNGSVKTGIGFDKGSNVLYLDSSKTANYIDYYHIDDNHPERVLTSVSFKPIDLELNAGDKLKLSVRAYCKWGDGTWHFSDWIDSDEVTIKNAGVAYVYVNKNEGTGKKPEYGWKEGVVHVYVNKNGGLRWVEADIVKVKNKDVTGGWAESTTTS